MLIKLLIISTILLLIAFAAMAVRIIFKTGGRFPETHISQNKEMQKRGITCSRKTDIGCNPSDNFKGCASCDTAHR